MNIICSYCGNLMGEDNEICEWCGQHKDFEEYESILLEWTYKNNYKNSKEIIMSQNRVRELFVKYFFHLDISNERTYTIIVFKDKDTDKDIFRLELNGLTEYKLPARIVALFIFIDFLRFEDFRLSLKPNIVSPYSINGYINRVPVSMNLQSDSVKSKFNLENKLVFSKYLNSKLKIEKLYTIDIKVIDNETIRIIDFSGFDCNDINSQFGKHTFHDVFYNNKKLFVRLFLELIDNSENEIDKIIYLNAISLINKTVYTLDNINFFYYWIAEYLVKQNLY